MAECSSGFTLGRDAPVTTEISLLLFSETLTLRTCLADQYDLQTVTTQFGAIITASPEFNDDSYIQRAVVRISNVEVGLERALSV